MLTDTQRGFLDLVRVAHLATAGRVLDTVLARANAELANVQSG